MKNDCLPNEPAEIGLKASTVAHYKRVIKIIEKSALARMQNDEFDQPSNISGSDLIYELHINAKKLKLTTLIVYRNALLYKFKEEKNFKLMSMLYQFALIPRLKLVAGKGNRKSRQKGRMIPEADFWKLHHQLGGMKNWGSRAQLLLEAGLASGARPVEWVNAKWVDKTNGVLRLQTAKIKNINALNRIPAMYFGELSAESDFENYEPSFFSDRLRMLNIDPEFKEELKNARFLENKVLFRDVLIEHEYISAVDRHMKNVEDFLNACDKNYIGNEIPLELKQKYFAEKYYAKCRLSVRNACKKIFCGDAMYSPIDTRSTFAANRRSMNGLTVTSEELGHHTYTKRVSAHYSKASNAWKKYREIEQGHIDEMNLIDGMEIQEFYDPSTGKYYDIPA